MQAGLSDGKKFNGDEAIQEYANLIGTPPKLLVPSDQVAEERAAAQQQAEQAQQMEMAQQGAQAAAAAGQVDLDGNNPVSAVLNG